MDTILTFLPAPARLYTPLLDGIRRRIANRFELQTIDYIADGESVRKLLDFWHPKGCIVVAAEGFDNLPHLAFGRTPVVYLDRTPLTKGNYLDVVQDYVGNGQEAARELLQPEIGDYAYVGYKEPTSWSQERGAAYIKAIRLQGKACHIFTKPLSASDRPKLLAKWLVALPKPAAIFAANDRTAIEVLTVCRKNGIRVPDDVTLLGIDNVVDICENAVPKISSIISDFEQAGWICADLLIKRLGNTRIRRATRLYPTLGVVRRASTRKACGYSPQITLAINTIRARACEGLVVDDVAATMGCSRRMAEIKFRQVTGKSIKETITETRLERAKVMLRDRSTSIREVATLCGYGTENALRIAFKKKFGQTLSDGRSPGREASRTTGSAPARGHAAARGSKGR